MKSINIGGVSVELADYAVGSCAILGIRDSGKTVTAKGIAEQLIDNDIPIIVFDAVGKWRWMKSASDHKNGKSYKVVVAGGRQPDLPLTPHSVPEIIRSALKERIPLIIDLYDQKLSKADWRRVVEQAIRIIHYENDGGAVHVFLEEAAEYCPQRIQPGQGDVYAEIEKLVRMGGNASVGITLINQRSQEINKAVLDNCSTALILGCQVGTNAIDAVGRWIERLDKSTATEVIESLPRLKSGEAWVWTRKSLDRPTKEKMPMCRSFHPDRRTPEVVLKALKPTDTGEFIDRMSAAIPKVIEEAKANDPKELKARIQQLERENKKLANAQPEPTKAEEVPFFSDKERAVIVEAQKSVANVQIYIEEKIASVVHKLTEIERAAMQRGRNEAHRFSTPNPLIKVAPSRPISRRDIQQPTNGELGKCERAILTALAQYPQGRTAVQVAVLSGYSASSGGFNNSLGKLRSAGYITRNQPMQATEEGIQALGPYDPLPTGEELARHWIGKLGRCEALILEALIKVHPNYMTAAEVAEATGYSPSSGGFNNSLGKLRTLELITRGQPMKASDDFFQ